MLFAGLQAWARLVFQRRIVLGVFRYSPSQDSTACIAASHPKATHTNDPHFWAAFKYDSCPGSHLHCVRSRLFSSHTKVEQPGITISESPSAMPIVLSMLSCWNCAPRLFPSFFGCSAITPSVSGYRLRNSVKKVNCSAPSFGHGPRQPGSP